MCLIYILILILFSINFFSIRLIPTVHLTLTPPKKKRKRDLEQYKDHKSKYIKMDKSFI